MNEVLDFIKRRFSNDCNWTSGNCYYFALILKDRFGGTILYDVINGHFVTLIEQYMYDWNGIVDNVDDCCKKQYIIWDDFDGYDSYQDEVKHQICKCGDWENVEIDLGIPHILFYVWCCG